MHWQEIEMPAPYFSASEKDLSNIDQLHCQVNLLFRFIMLDKIPQPTGNQTDLDEIVYTTVPHGG